MRANDEQRCLFYNEPRAGKIHGCKRREEKLAYSCLLLLRCFWKWFHRAKSVLSQVWFQTRMQAYGASDRQELSEFFLNQKMFLILRGGFGTSTENLNMFAHLFYYVLSLFEHFILLLSFHILTHTMLNRHGTERFAIRYLFMPRVTLYTHRSNHPDGVVQTQNSSLSSFNILLSFFSKPLFPFLSLYGHLLPFSLFLCVFRVLNRPSLGLKCSDFFCSFSFLNFPPSRPHNRREDRI